MEQKQVPQQKQKLALSQYQRQSLNVLALDAYSLGAFIEQAVGQNPLLEADWSGIQTSGSIENSSELLPAPTDSIVSDLLFQMHVSAPNPQICKIGEYLILALDSHGYLDCTLISAASELGVPIGFVKQALRLLQSFDPPGVGARNLRESLFLQLKRRINPNPLALSIVRSHFDLLILGNETALSETLHVPQPDIRCALQAIRRLNPFPFTGTYGGETRYVRPELLVFLKDGEPVVAPIQQTPRLSIREFEDDSTLDVSARRWMRGYLTDARQLISAVSRRQQTLLNIGRQIAAFQRAFFLSGAALTALTQETVAAALNISSSTVCRAMKETFLQFENRIIALNSFFPSHVASGASSAEIKAVIMSVISGEDSNQPLSDGMITRYLSSIGYPLSKRTVTKYRTEAGIPNSFQRNSACS